MPTRALTFPGAFDDASLKQAGDVLGFVGAAVEHDDDLIAEAKRFKALRELSLLVMRDDDRGDQRTPAAHAPFARCEARPRGAVISSPSMFGGLAAL
jgi:hypothetical protein